MRLALITWLLLVATIIVVCNARAADVNDPTLNGIATLAAGKNVNVHCETDALAWDKQIGTVYSGKYRGVEVRGYAWAGQADVFIGPDICVPLLNAQAGPYAAGLRPLAAALQVLLHEAMHSKGETGEAAAECQSLALLPTYLKFVKVPDKVVRFYKKAGRWLPKTVANPDKAVMLQYAQWVHSRLPAEYQGGC